jgi:hypothetical protein
MKKEREVEVAEKLKKAFKPFDFNVDSDDSD